MKRIKQRLRQCDCCGSPMPECYALCFVCLSDERGRRIAALEKAFASEVRDKDEMYDRAERAEAERDDYKDRWEQTGCTRHGAMEAAIKVNKELLKDIAELKAAICKHQESFNLRDDEPRDVDYELWAAL